MHRSAPLLATLVLLIVTAPSIAAELVRLSEKNWDEFVPRGKEVDAIYGDYVLRNDKIVVVIANPIFGRHANLTVKEVAGCIIDMTRSDVRKSNDQLSAYYPNAMRTPYRSMSAGVDGAVLLRVGDESVAGSSIFVEVVSDPAKDKEELEAYNKPRIEKDKLKMPAKPRPVVRTRYTLKDEWDYVLVETTYRNTSEEEITVDLVDSMRADKSFEHGVDVPLNTFWAYDRWWGQAYALVGDGAKIVPGPAATGRIPALLNYEVKGERKVTLAPGKTFTLTRRLIVGRHTFDVLATAAKLAQEPVQSVTVHVRDSAGGVADADVIATTDGKPSGRGRTNAHGLLDVKLQPATYQFEVYAQGRTKQVVNATVIQFGPTGVDVKMDDPGYVTGAIVNAADKPTPCKVQFIAVQPAGVSEEEDAKKDAKKDDEKESDPKRIPNPLWFPDSGEHAVNNCIYTHDGRFRQPITPGKYKVIISYGTEHDALYRDIEVTRGKTTLIDGKLNRSVHTTGWISTDFHSHSSPSGDNTASQLGRVHNLLCEHIEFAPCTEHQRVDSYTPHLKKLGVEHLLATCTGIELTGSDLPVNHQNAFPLTHKPRTQDGGGPLVDYDPRVQIERIFMWDNKAEKVVQQNHPDIIRMFFDKDGDKKADGGLGMAPFMNVIEIHPPHAIFTGPMWEYEGKKYPSRIFNWLVLLNKGYRIPGVVNTDAHYNYHGSGWLRNYVKSPTDDPAKVQTIDVVRETNKGRIVMTTGPFMEVTASDADFGRSEPPTVGPGDDLKTKKGKTELWVRVQCPNWFDINRVQVFINGRPDEKLNFTRKTTADKFGNGTVKFEAVLNVEQKTDYHIIVAAIGEGLKLGPVMGPQHGKDTPVAVSNPIFVDVDGDGFKANGDELGAELPK